MGIPHEVTSDFSSDQGMYLFGLVGQQGRVE